ncbi:uncharacterized protein LOC126907969 [Daktulosphaira vitifoliae]|uniref:uncharacterized protein LOC126907969 n=1 Tax=Daktulosphaira vitifoliae TaxID=58002 RepID=UPI0021AAE1D2|nr:uncharacterized protein LOC126907969 [Daktulosphaira vitifoliae]XP_050545682.1 uncharacterized protein LOC126907969 [Daktulosphaira vitifoliae]
MSNNLSTICNAKTTEVNVELLRYIMQLLNISREEVDQLVCTLESSDIPDSHVTNENQLLRCNKCSKSNMTSFKNKALSSRSENPKQTNKDERFYPDSTLLDEYDTFMSRFK